jgi:hypothetical protein
MGAFWCTKAGRLAHCSVELCRLQTVSIQHCRAFHFSNLFNSKAGRVALAEVGKAAESGVVIMFTSGASSPLIVHSCCTTQPRSNHHIHHLIAPRRPLVLVQTAITVAHFASSNAPAASLPKCLHEAPQAIHSI